MSAEVQQLCPLLAYMCLWHSPVGTLQGTGLTGIWVPCTCHLHSWGNPHVYPAHYGSCRGSPCVCEGCNVGAGYTHLGCA